MPMHDSLVATTLVSGRPGAPGAAAALRLNALLADVAGRGRAAEGAFADFYDATAARVQALLRRFVGNAHSAADVMQDVYCQAWVQAERFNPERGPALAWILTLARSRALDHLRKQASQPVIYDQISTDTLLDLSADEQCSVVDAMASRQERALLHEALKKVSPTARQMIALAFFADMSQTEISAHLQVPLGTVKSTLLRAYKSLQRHLGHAAPELALAYGGLISGERDD